MARTPHFVLHCLVLASGAEGTQKTLFSMHRAWLGAMVPKRWARRAVTRNTIKRQVFAVAQAIESSLDNAALVVRLRRGFDRQHFPSASSVALKLAVRTELTQLFGKLGTSCLNAV